MRDAKEYTHPSYGLACFSRINGHSGTMFGSDVTSNEYIELRIEQNATMVHDNVCGRHFYASDKIRNNVVTLKMTNTQFADLITNMNRVDGVPCTIESIGGIKVEQVEENVAPNILDEHRKDFKVRLRKIADELRKHREQACKLLSKPSLTKRDREELMSVLNRYIIEVDSNLEFFAKQFYKSADKITQEAKTEIAAAIQGSIIRAGISALGFSPEDEKK